MSYFCKRVEVISKIYTQYLIIKELYIVTICGHWGFFALSMRSYRQTSLYKVRILKSFKFQQLQRYIASNIQLYLFVFFCIIIFWARIALKGFYIFPWCYAPFVHQYDVRHSLCNNRNERYVASAYTFYAIALDTFLGS